MATDGGALNIGSATNSYIISCWIGATYTNTLQDIHAALTASTHGVSASGFEDKANKGAVSGYAPLDANQKVPTVNLGGDGADNTKYLRGDQTWQVPTASTAWGSITGTLSNQTDLQNALNAKEATANKGV